MSRLMDAEVFTAIARIIEKYQIFQCQECATEIMEWCADRGIEATKLKIETRWDEDWILSDRYSNNESITDNGKHYGVEVRGLVFDNLSRLGMTREAWIEDFHSPMDEFIVSEL